MNTPTQVSRVAAGDTALYPLPNAEGTISTGDTNNASALSTDSSSSSSSVAAGAPSTSASTGSGAGSASTSDRDAPTLKMVVNSELPGSSECHAWCVAS